MTMESPVWMPMGSKFSMLHTVMQLSFASRTTSYSSSFHPLRLLSTITCELCANDTWTRLRNSSGLAQKPLPRPPSAKAARTNTGYPIFAAAATASFTEEQQALSATL